MNLWNIGAEGQFHAGAIGATWIALTFGGWSSGALLPAMVVGSLVAGAIWTLVAALPRALWGVNEIITTLLLNYIAILAVAYLVTGPWRSAQRFPQTELFVPAAVLPRLGSSLVHVGVFFPLAAAAVLVFVLQRSKWGFEVRLIGANPEAARLTGISTARNIVVVMLVAGALAGIAGMVEVSVTFGRLQNGISPGYGYMAIVIAALARANLAGTLVIAILFGGFVIGGYALQTLGIPAAFVLLMQGTILFSALAGARLAGYRLGSWLPTRLRARWLTKEEPSTL
jgi:general nucleoside transport system permease protein